jgi:hypothetical protein
VRRDRDRNLVAPQSANLHLEEHTTGQLQADMAAGRYTARQIAEAYLARAADYTELASRGARGMRENFRIRVPQRRDGPAMPGRWLMNEPHTNVRRTNLLAVVHVRVWFVHQASALRADSALRPA